MAGQVGIVKKIETIAPGLLNPSAYNPRTISPQEFAKLRRSLREFGFVEPVVVNNGNKIIGGHQRVRAAIEEGLKRVPIVRLDLPETKAKALNLALNRITGEWDLPLLKNLLGELATPDFDIEITGFDESEIETMMTAISVEDAKREKRDPAKLVDEAAVLQRKWRVKRGQMWRIPNSKYHNSEHTVLCADCLEQDGLLGRKADMTFTDPPWNVAIGGDSNPYHRQRKHLVTNDHLTPSQYTEFIRGAAVLLRRNIRGDIYCVMGAMRWGLLDAKLTEAGFRWSATIIWLKDRFVFGRSKYHRRYEPIWYGWPADARSTFRGGRKQDDIWEIRNRRVSPEHATMKPVELPLHAIQNSSKRGALIYDPFLGAGSTMVAAEQIGRVRAGVEIEPKFVAVVLERMANLGLKPRLAK